ncbi:hypothetical protein ATORI0001_0290 [Lancefieldella rimae ATCC 49626]|uniref:Uncharacterized protein n=1 Tax=Lancefieldella rimae (strain ATCC 49626 / DSM 7090 / CCUG 31168 / NBRC 15546 / VPI D140H-11A) TaxID=553184 RepID=B9CP85_LANR4|nr:hypothetical protein ATORI0001_0290 [Lancefieldella rimae ATCC 49626]
MQKDLQRLFNGNARFFTCWMQVNFLKSYLMAKNNVSVLRIVLSFWGIW